MKTLFGSSTYPSKGMQVVNPELSYRRRAGAKASWEPVSRLTRA